MKKSIILTGLFALIASGGVFAQTLSRPAETGTPKEEKKVEKTTPSEARPGAEAPETRPTNPKEGEKAEKSTQPEARAKSNNGKKKGHSKGPRGKGKAKGHNKEKHDQEAEESHEGHNHGDSAKKPGQTAEPKKGNRQKDSKPPVETPKSDKQQKTGEKN